MRRNARRYQPDGCSPKGAITPRRLRNLRRMVAAIPRFTTAQAAATIKVGQERKPRATPRCMAALASTKG